MVYLPLLVACVSGLISLSGVIWLAVRNARTSKELETLKASLAHTLEESKAAFAHRTAVDLASRKAKLERVNAQLKQLYGPLYALAFGSHRAWLTFRASHGPKGPFWASESPPTPDDAAAWRLWMTSVFMPLNLEMERLVLQNMDLLCGEHMDESLLDLCAHVEAYKTVIERWKQGDYSIHVTRLDFPGEALRKYVGEQFVELKREQERLLSSQLSPTSPTPDKSGA